jgi:hypothetical protein
MTVGELGEELGLDRRRTEPPDLVVWGLGSLGTKVLEQVAAAHPRHGFGAVTSDPCRALAVGANVAPVTFGELAGNRAPVLVCVADDEGQVLRSCAEMETARAAVAHRNQTLIETYLDPAVWRDRPVLLVTNPVELLCARVAEVAGDGNVFGVGMQVDAHRCVDALAAGWGIEVEPGMLPVTGMHCVAPTPVLSAVPGLAERILAEPWPAVAQRLRDAAEDFTLPWVRRPERMAAVFAQRGPAPDDDPYGRLGLAVAGITAAEFTADRPPIERAIGHVVDLVGAWLDGAPVAVSGACRVPGAGDEPAFVGGIADLPSGEFRVPDLDDVEAALVARQATRMRALAAAVRAA